MSGIFPMIQPETEPTAAPLPLCREFAWDFEAGRPIFSGGAPVFVSGREAVRVWIWKALRTVRFRHEIFSWDYGCEAEHLMGQAFTAEVKQSEAIRYVREALRPNPYITELRQINVNFSGDRLEIDCAAETIYGEVDIRV